MVMVGHLAMKSFIKGMARGRTRVVAVDVCRQVDWRPPGPRTGYNQSWTIVEIRNELRGIQSEGVREFEEFSDIDPSLAALDSRDVGLSAIHSVGERRLRQSRAFPRLRQQLS